LERIVLNINPNQIPKRAVWLGRATLRQPVGWFSTGTGTFFGAEYRIERLLVFRC